MTQQIHNLILLATVGPKIALNVQKGFKKSNENLPVGGSNTGKLLGISLPSALGLVKAVAKGNNSKAILTYP